MPRSIMRRAAVLLATVGLMVAGLGTAAVAATGDTAVVGVPMTLDCAALSTSAHQYAVAHGYCAGTSTGGVRPANTEPGDCGTSYFYIDNLGGGNARFRWGFTSSGGAVIARSLGVYWDNTRWGNSGYWPDNSAMASSTYNATPRTVGTGSGPVSGYLDGWVVLWWGGTCTINYPWDTRTIT